MDVKQNVPQILQLPQGSSVLRIVSFCVRLILDFVGRVERSETRQKRERVAS